MTLKLCGGEGEGGGGGGGGGRRVFVDNLSRSGSGKQPACNLSGPLILDSWEAGKGEGGGMEGLRKVFLLLGMIVESNLHVFSVALTWTVGKQREGGGVRFFIWKATCMYSLWPYLGGWEGGKQPAGIAGIDRGIFLLGGGGGGERRMRN